MVGERDFSLLQNIQTSSEASSSLGNQILPHG